MEATRENREIGAFRVDRLINRRWFHPSRKRQPVRRRHRPTRAVVALLGLLVLVGLAFVAVAVLSGGWQIRPILSGSMRPGFPIGGVVVTQRIPLLQLRLRDVAVFHPPGEPTIDYVHRVIFLRRTPHGLVVHTQGDDNLYPDPWTLHLGGQYAYVARFTLPLVGYAAVWAHSPEGRRTILLAAGLLALVLVVAALREHRRGVVGPSVTATASTGSVDHHIT